MIGRISSLVNAQGGAQPARPLPSACRHVVSPARRQLEVKQGQRGEPMSMSLRSVVTGTRPQVHIDVKASTAAADALVATTVL